MRVLVTGGAGYIGGVAVEKLLAAGHTVAVLDNFWRGHRGSVPAGCDVFPCDLTDAAATLEAVKAAKPDAIMHFAAATIVPESVADPARYFTINTSGSLNLLAAAVEAGVRRLVFSSTAAVYGMPERLPVQEDDIKVPINPYGQSKLMVEQMLPWFEQAYGLTYAALRYFNVAGATKGHGEVHEPETHVIPVALETLVGKRDHFQVFGTDYPTPDGTAIRDYVHVIDLVNAHLLALDKLVETGKSLGAINLGTKDGFSVKAIVDAVERVTGKTLPVKYVERRAGDPPALIADSTKARTVLGWNPQHSTLDEMVGSAWDWLQGHPRGYE